MLPSKRAVGAEAEDNNDLQVVAEFPHSHPNIDPALKKPCLISAAAATSSSSSVTVATNGNSRGAAVNGESERPIMGLGDGNGGRNNNSSEIDEDLHSRQLAVYGRETMRRLFASNVLISGLQGLGAEIGMNFSFFWSSPIYF